MTKNENASGTESWAVICQDHSHGAANVDFLRKTEKDAQRSAKLFRQCGYQSVVVKQYTK